MSSVKKNFFYSSILTTANYIFPLITYPYVSRVLEVTNIGAVNFVDSIIQYFILFSMMGISVTGIREIASSKGDKKRMSGIFSSLLMLNLISTGIMLLVLIIGMYFIPSLIPHRQLLWIGVLKLIFNLFLIEWFYKGIEAFKYITQRAIFVRIIYVILIFIFVRNINDRSIYYLLTVSTIIINAIINIVYSHKFVHFNLKLIKLKSHIKSFFRLGIYNLLTSAYTTFNVMYLGFICGDTQVGYYTTAIKIFHIIISLFTAFTGVMLPRMSSLISEGKLDELKSKTNISIKILISIMIPAIIFIVILVPEIIMIISGPGYSGAITPMRIITPVLLLAGFDQIMIIQIMMPMKMDKLILRNSTIAAIIAIILNLGIIKYLQSTGSAIILLTSELTIFILAISAVYKKIKIVFPFNLFSVKILYYLPLIIILTTLQYIKLGNYFTIVLDSIITISYFIIVELFLFRKNSILYYLIPKLIKRKE